MDYNYDVFFSYKRDTESNFWHEMLVRKLGYWTKQELNVREVRIFFDVESIQTGERWREKIATSLKTSKCMVAVWSPEYFHSPWCYAEWRSFVERKEMLQLETGLVVPARYHDGDFYPVEARAVQAADFREYASTIRAFWDSLRADDFERSIIKSFARDVADAIRRAPKYIDSFPVASVDLEPLKVPSIKKPEL